MNAPLFGDEQLERRIQADLAFQRHLDSLWGTRFMIPHIYTGTYYEVETSRGMEILSGWEVGPTERLDASNWLRSFRLNRLLDGRRTRPVELMPQGKTATLGRLLACDPEHEHYRVAKTPWLVGTDRWDVAKKLWDKYGYVTR